eukprot:281678-Pelagomonas_calceolata.AAC.4
MAEPVGNGDKITLDAEKRVMDVHISDEEMAARKEAWIPRPFKATSGAELLALASRVRNHLTRAASWTSKDFGYRHLSALAKHAAAVVAADGSCCKFVCWQTVRALVALQQPRRQQVFDLASRGPFP